MTASSQVYANTGAGADGGGRPAEARRGRGRVLRQRRAPTGWAARARRPGGRRGSGPTALGAAPGAVVRVRRGCRSHIAAQLDDRSQSVRLRQGWLSPAGSNDSATLGGRVPRGSWIPHSWVRPRATTACRLRLDGGRIEPAALPVGGHLGLQRPGPGAVAQRPLVVGLEHPAHGRRGRRRRCRGRAGGRRAAARRGGRRGSRGPRTARSRRRGSCRWSTAPWPGARRRPRAAGR